MAPIALTSRLSALTLCFSASLASLGYAATADAARRRKRRLVPPHRIQDAGEAAR
jgi:hypothetical protein